MKAFLLSALILLALISCNEDDQIIGEGNCFEVSLVDELCGQVVIKIEDPAYYEFGEFANGEDNVFYARLKCRDFRLPEQGSFMVEIVEEYAPGNCAICEALLTYDGVKNYDIRLVDICREN